MNKHYSRLKKLQIPAIIIKLTLLFMVFSCTQPDGPAISEPSELPTNLRTSHYENGLYTAYIFGFSYITQYQSHWDKIIINISSPEFHFADNGISGKGTIPG